MLMPMLANAQDYEPFIVEGKAWYYEHVDYLRSYIYKVYFEGDTVIDGHSCKKMVEERPGFPTYSTCACREEGGKVWVYYSQYASQPWQEWLLFDFTCQEGDTLTNILVYGGEKFRVDDVGSIRSFGCDRRRIAMRRNNGSIGYWLEGVGNRFNLFCMWPVTGASERFLYCKLNGETIADQSSFGDAALENFGLEPEPVLGDVDGDGTVSITDVAMIVDYILGVGDDNFIAANANVDGDSEIGINDVMGAASIILGDEKTKPISPAQMSVSNSPSP